jgi:hypothetical protein
MSILNVNAAFLPPAPSFLSLANLCCSARSFINRSLVLLYSWPLKDRPSSLGFCSVDAKRLCRRATTRAGRDVDEELRLTVESRALDGARLGNDIPASRARLILTALTYGGISYWEM